MANSRTGHQFGAAITFSDGDDGSPTKQVDTFQSIKKPLQSIRFGQHIPDDAAKLAYVGTQELDADKNLVIIDHSSDLIGNSRDFTSEEDTFEGKIFNSYYKNILPTDVWTTATATQPTKPLYYKHELDNTVTFDSVEILNSDFQPVGIYQYKVEYVYVYNETTGLVTTTVDYIAVYNNFMNSYDEDTGIFTAYYIRYTESDNTVKTVLVDNQPVFRLATVSDVWTDANLKTWLKVYTYEELGAYYKFKFAASGTFSVQILENARVYLETPAVDDKDFPWFLRVGDGSFIYVTETGTRYIYDVPEFHTQLFNPIEPYKLAPSEQVDKIAPGIIQLQHKLLESTLYPIDIIIKSASDVVLYALTTDPLKLDSYYQDTTILWSSTRIASLDSIGGFVHLDLDIKDTYKINATYYYEEKFYEFLTLDLNPIYNTDAASGGFYAVYLVPRSTTNYGLDVDETIYYIKINKSGKITACSEAALNDTVALGGVIGMTYGDRNNVVASTFLYDYTTLAPTGAGGKTTRYFILGEVSVVESTSINDIVILDVRVDGGGVKEASLDEARQTNPEVAWFTGVNALDGQPYPGQASTVVKLPYTVLTDYGGRFTPVQVQEIVKRHMAFGVYPLIRYYGVIPDIYLEEDSLDLDAAVKLYWRAEHADYTFRVYKGLQQNGTFTKDNSTDIQANGTDVNWYWVQGLSNGLVYWLYVTAVDTNGVEGPKSKKIKITPYVDGITRGWVGHEFAVTV